MQDMIYSIGAAGQIISGGGGDRRLRQQQHHQQELKCPRCDSLNTKFCYYNNYNLSQPRHFCKNCRRYWTKGGVLRNVPVGGGCRKAKRAKTKPSSETPPQQQRVEQKSNSHSSSEGSSITAANSSTVAVTNNAISSSAGGGAEEVSAHSSLSNLLNTTESKFHGQRNSDSGLEQGLLEQGSDCGIFSEFGTFTSLITSSTNEALSFGFGLDQENQWQNQIPSNYHQQKMSMGVEEITAGRLFDPTVQVEPSALQSRSNGGGFGIFGPLDWQGNGDQELFDLPTAVDQTYWSQNHCSDEGHPSIFLP